MEKGFVVALTLLLACVRTSFGQVPAADCDKPSVLRVTSRSNELWYQVDANTAHKLYSLGEVSKSVRSCPTVKMLFVIADPDIPIAKLMVPNKEQITRVRYFIQYSTGEVQEISFEHMYPKLPVTPDISPIPDDDDTLHPPTKIPSAKGQQ